MNAAQRISAIEWLRVEFDRVAPILQRVIDRNGGGYDLAYVWSLIEADKAQLWPGLNAAVVTQIETSPSGITGINWWLAAGDMAEVKAMQDHIIPWAKTKGCTVSTIVGRRGWLRELDGYKEVSTVMAKDI